MVLGSSEKEEMPEGEGRGIMEEVWMAYEKEDSITSIHSF